MKKLIILTLVAFVSLTSFAQSSVKAKALLDEVAKKAASYDNMYVEFSHKFDNKAADIHQETRGNVTLKGDLYHFNYMGTEQLFDGHKVYLIIHEDEEVIVKSNDSDEEEGVLSPSKMFTFYKKGFNYEMDALKNVNGRSIQYIKLSPIDSNSEIKEILLGVDTKTKHIKKLIETGIDGNKTTLIVTTFKTNQTVSEKLFQFNQEKFEEMDYDITEPK